MQLAAIYDTDSVEIYDGSERVAIHQRSPIAEGYTTVIDHMPENHKAYHSQKGWDSTYFLQEAQKIGCHTHAYIKRFSHQDRINSRLTMLAEGY